MDLFEGQIGASLKPDSVPPHKPTRTQSHPGDTRDSSDYLSNTFEDYSGYSSFEMQNTNETNKPISGCSEYLLERLERNRVAQAMLLQHVQSDVETSCSSEYGDTWQSK